MRVTSSTGRGMALEPISMQMEISMKESGNMTNNPDQASTTSAMAANTMGNG